jgi:hypothetical protein
LPLRDVTNVTPGEVDEVGEPEQVVVLVESSADDELLSVNQAYMLYLHKTIAGARAQTK